MAVSTPVIVHVYDLADFNVYLNWAGLGAYHTGVQCHGREYAFGAHPYDCSGIFNTAPLDAPGQVTYHSSIHVGDTYYTVDELHDIIEHMGAEYTGLRYHFLQTNCNSFSSDLCFALCGQRPPAWINRLAGVALTLHCLCPTTFVPPLQPPSMCPYGDKDLPVPRGGHTSEEQALLRHLETDEIVPMDPSFRAPPRRTGGVHTAATTVRSAASGATSSGRVVMLDGAVGVHRGRGGQRKWPEDGAAVEEGSGVGGSLSLTEHAGTDAAAAGHVADGGAETSPRGDHTGRRRSPKKTPRDAETPAGTVETEPLLHFESG